jgi:uncharacterized protein
MQWLIDGHNLIGQMPGLRLDDPDDEAKLVEYLRRYRARTGHHITVIFDTGQSYRVAETKKQGGVTVQFASPRQTADQIIIQRLRQVKNSQEVIVVSSDRAIQQAARQARVRILTSPEFAQQLLQELVVTGSDEEQPDRINRQLSPAEVDEWLTLFKNRRKHDRTRKKPAVK